MEIDRVAILFTQPIRKTGSGRVKARQLPVFRDLFSLSTGSVEAGYQDQVSAGLRIESLASQASIGGEL